MGLKVYFDGECGFCGSAVRFYRKKDHERQLEFIDITAANFVAKEHGLDPDLIMKKMHVKNDVGTVFSGGDAVIEIWSVLDQYRWLARIVGIWPLRPIFHWGYMAFATYIRPLISSR